MDKKLINRIKTIRSLYQSATIPGEKAAAQDALLRLMEKHGLTDTDIDNLFEKRRRIYFHVSQDEFLHAIFIQCLGVATKWRTGRSITTFSHRNPNLLGAELTAEEEKTVRVLWSVYKEGWLQAQKNFFSVWLNKQGAILKPADENSAPSTEEVRRWWRENRQLYASVKELPNPTAKRLHD